ncbi:hypothetical protein L0244_17680, partial [bacterium]|nr:hypothetical protein [bacterium]
GYMMLMKMQPAFLGAFSVVGNCFDSVDPCNQNIFVIDSGINIFIYSSAKYRTSVFHYKELLLM